jgi:hypothetical protein
MESLLAILLAISAMFFVFLGVKEIVSKKSRGNFCAICLAVSFTWISLFLLYLAQIFNDVVIIAILMGQTSLGIFYVLEKNMKENQKMLRLPILLTLISASYMALQWTFSLPGTLFLGGLWGVFLGIFAIRDNPNVSGFVKKLVECCRNW